MQSLAVTSLQNGLVRLDKRLGINAISPDKKAAALQPQGALVAIETNTGAVKALVGGKDYLETEYNRALQNNRLPGSGFKPFLYYAIFETIDPVSGCQWEIPGSNFIKVALRKGQKVCETAPHDQANGATAPGF